MTKPTEQPNCDDCGFNPWKGEENTNTNGLELNPRNNQPNQTRTGNVNGHNAMIFDQIDGCCDIMKDLLNELVPKTEKVKGCIYKLKEWRGDYLRILRAAFE